MGSPGSRCRVRGRARRRWVRCGSFPSRSSHPGRVVPAGVRCVFPSRHEAPGGRPRPSLFTSKSRALLSKGLLPARARAHSENSPASRPHCFPLVSWFVLGEKKPRMGATSQPRCQQDRGRVSGPHPQQQLCSQLRQVSQAQRPRTPQDGADLCPPLSEADLGHPDRGQFGRQQALGTDPPR